MKKQKIALLLSLSWLIGMIVVFSFPPALIRDADQGSHQSFLKESAAPELIVSITGESPEVPGFKADWKFVGFAAAEHSIALLASAAPTLSPEFPKNSKPLFEVLITFFYFFYTW